MKSEQRKLFRAYNITWPWAHEFSYVLDYPQWSFEDVLMRPVSARDIPWTVAKTLLGAEAANKGSILYNVEIMHEYARTLAVIDTLHKISLSCEKFACIITHGNAKWAIHYLNQSDDISVLRRDGRKEYCIFVPAACCHKLLDPLAETFSLQSVLESFNPIVKPA